MKKEPTRFYTGRAAGGDSDRRDPGGDQYSDFTAQRKKAVIAANQANVRAAKAAAVAMLYGSKESLERYENQPQKQYRYYRYNVKEGKIVCQAQP